MKNILMITVILAGATMTAGAVQAQDGRDRPDFSTLDTDGDGGVTREELRALAANRFAERDTDGDGALSAEEIAAAEQANRADRINRMIERLDQNGDGLLQQDEIAQAERVDRMNRMFERADADGDGAISEEEFEQVKERRGGRRGGHGRGHGRGRG